MSTNISNPSNTLAKVRWQEPYVSQGLNRKLNGLIPSGVIRGGVLGTNLAALSVTIEADPVTGDSVYSYINANGEQVTFRQAGNITLDLTPVAGTTVYVALFVDYTALTPTVVYWRTYSEAELFGGAPVAEADYVVISGRVVVPAAGVIPAANITPAGRREGWASRSTCLRDWRLVTPEGSFQSCAVSTFTAADNRWGGWLTDLLSTIAVVTADIQTAQARSGDRSLRVTFPGGLLQQELYLAHGALFECHEGQLIDASVWVMSTALAPALGAGGHLGLMFEFFTEAGGAAGTEYVEDLTLVGAFAWTEVSRILAVPATAAYARVYVVADDDAAGSIGDLFFDDVRVFISKGHAKDDYGIDDPVRAVVRANSIDISPVPTAVALTTLIDSTIRLAQTAASGGLLRAVMRARGALATYPFGLLLDAGALTIDRVIEGLGADMVGSLANAAIARITAILPAVATSPYVLLAHFPQTDAVQFPIRIYGSGTSSLATVPGEMIFGTINALWRNATDDWTRDVAGDSVLFGLSRDGIYLRWYPAAGAATWTHAQWTSIAGPRGEPIMSVIRAAAGGTLVSLNNALISFGTGLGATAVTNPAALAATVVNTLYAKSFPKAWGRITTDGIGGVVLTDGLGISNVAPQGGAPTSVRVTFNNAFSNANYTAITTVFGAGLGSDDVFHEAAAVGSSDFCYMNGGVKQNLSGLPAVAFNVVFFGEQA